MYHNWGCTSICRPFSYPFRCLINLPANKEFATAIGVSAEAAKAANNEEAILDIGASTPRTRIFVTICKKIRGYIDREKEDYPRT